MPLAAQDAAGYDPPTTLFFYFFKRPPVRFYGKLVNKRTDVIVRVQGITNVELGIGFGKSLLNLFVDSILNDQSSCSSATLACGAHGAKQRSADRNVKVCVFGDNKRIVAAQFKQGPSQSLAYSFGNDFSHANRTGRGNQRDPFAGCQ